MSNKVKAAKKKVKEMKAKMKAAEKRMNAAERNGSDKQYNRAKAHFETWQARYDAAVEKLSAAKEGEPSLIDKIKASPIVTWTNLAVVTVATAGVAAAVIIMTGDEEDSEPVADKV